MSSSNWANAALGGDSRFGRLLAEEGGRCHQGGTGEPLEPEGRGRAEEEGMAGNQFYRKLRARRATRDAFRQRGGRWNLSRSASREPLTERVTVSWCQWAISVSGSGAGAAPGFIIPAPATGQALLQRIDRPGQDEDVGQALLHQIIITRGAPGWAPWTSMSMTTSTPRSRFSLHIRLERCRGSVHPGVFEEFTTGDFLLELLLEKKK